MATEFGGAQAPAGNDIRTAALQFLRWAHDRSLLAPDAYYPGDTVGAPAFDEEFNESGAVSVLRNRQVRFLSIDQASGRISVFVRKTAPSLKELKVLPRHCNGFSVQYHQGNPETVSSSAVATATNACSTYVTGHGSVYTCGSSISIGNNREAGTLGCLVSDNAGTLFGLTNNHVSGGCSYAPTGLPVLAPGIADVTPNNPYPFTLGIHSRQLPMGIGDPTSIDHTQNSDAALIQIVTPQLISSMQRGHYDTPASVMDMVSTMQIEKVGRTTDRTRGVVMGEIVGAVAINYSASQYGFAGNVFFEPLFVAHGIGDIFSDSGDSGSLVTHIDAAGVRHAVGLVVGGGADNNAPGNKISLLLPLRPILERLQVSLVTGHNV